ncbi:MAG TPA: DUF4395 family protein [Capsulimonadaceae bacterium]|jgi:hypothetical protein
MSQEKMVAIHKGSFAFCRYSLAALSWLALALQSRPVVVVAAVVMLVSAAVGIERAPMIALWNATGERLRRTPLEALDERAMRFAHSFGFALFTVDAALLAFPATVTAGWVLLAFISVAKTMGALGFCAASKMYTCATNDSGNCCRFWKWRQGLRKS